MLIYSVVNSCILQESVIWMKIYSTQIITFQTNHEHVFLQGEDKLYLNTGDITSKSSQYGGCESHILVGSKQWQIIPISHSYLASNWPIRVGVDWPTINII